MYYIIISIIIIIDLEQTTTVHEMMCSLNWHFSHRFLLQDFVPDGRENLLTIVRANPNGVSGEVGDGRWQTKSFWSDGHKFQLVPFERKHCRRHRFGGG